MNRRDWFSTLIGGLATLFGARPRPSPPSSLGGLSESAIEDLIASVREHEGAQAFVVLGKPCGRPGLNSSPCGA
jgi:hypothetical protein